MGAQLTIDSGDTAWMLVSTALVMLMVLPGLALFYGGLVRAKNLLSVMSQALGISAVAILTWVLWNYSLAFSAGNWLIGDFTKAGFVGLTDAKRGDGHTTVPVVFSSAGDRRADCAADRRRGPRSRAEAALPPATPALVARSACPAVRSPARSR